jgi:hypothetical protein
MIEQQYKCDLCGRELTPTTPSGRYPQGWALTWTGPGRGAFPNDGARLEPCRSWPESPKHLCQVCVRAVHEFFVAAEAVGEIQPEPRSQKAEGG